MCQLLEAYTNVLNKNQDQAWNLLSPGHTQDWLPREHVLGTKITFIEQYFKHINSPFVHIVQNARELIRCQQEVYNNIIEE